MYLVDVRAAPTAFQHPRDEPARNVGREMADHVATWCVHPDPGIIGAGRIRNENQPITGVQTVHDLSALTEDRPVHRCAKVIVVRGIWRWFHHLGPSRSS
jgi:hypothetical protein